MKVYERPIGLSDPENELLCHSRVGKFFNPPLSDFEIISLQNLIMTPSIQHIKTKDIKTGRFLMQTFLRALNYYDNIGCLTLEDNWSLESHVFDFAHLGKNAHSLIDAIENFCIEQAIDFVWIELTQKLKDQISESQLNKFCEIILSNAQTPIVVINYGQEWV